VHRLQMSSLQDMHWPNTLLPNRKHGFGFRVFEKGRYGRVHMCVTCLGSALAHTCPCADCPVMCPARRTEQIKQGQVPPSFLGG
jgi:hypothetical protein